MKAFVRMLACCCAFVMACAAAAMAPENIPARVGFDQRLGAAIPPGLKFRDENGADVRLATYFGRSPSLLVFAYFGCSNLCPTVIGNLAEALDRAGNAAGSRYQVLVVSIDPGDSPGLAATKKAAYLSGAQRPDAGKGWHLLTGSPANIAALTDAAGYRYAYDGDVHQYAHPAGVVVLTPQGTIARYFFGFDYTPGELLAALDAAAAKRIDSPAQRLLLLCFHFEPAGKYGPAVLGALRWSALAACLALAAAFAAARWSPRRARARRRRD
jgi:protein SCO1/2